MMLGKIFNTKMSSLLIIIIVLFLIMCLLRYFGMYEGLEANTTELVEPDSKTATSDTSKIKKYNF